MSTIAFETYMNERNVYLHFRIFSLFFFNIKSPIRLAPTLLLVSSFTRVHIQAHTALTHTQPHGNVGKLISAVVLCRLSLNIVPFVSSVVYILQTGKYI